MKKLVLWDFDNTLINTNGIILNEFLWEHQMKKNKKNIDKFYNIPINEELLSIGNFTLTSGMLKYANPVENAQEVVDELYNNYNFNQKCLTARPEKHKEIVEYLIKKYFSKNIKDIYFMNSFETKIPYAKELRAHVLIDDTLKSFEGIEKTKLLGILYDPLNNYKDISLPKQLKKIKTLDEVLSYL